MKLLLLLGFILQCDSWLLYKLVRSLNRVQSNYYERKYEMSVHTDDSYPKEIPAQKSKPDISPQDKYDLSWYVIGTPSDISPHKPLKVTIWNKNYAVWRNYTTGEYYGVDDVCPHKGASLAGGKIVNGCLACPYHGYEYDCNGKLKIVPGIDITNHSASNPSTTIYDVAKYQVVERNGWVYLNTIASQNNTNVINIFEEPEAANNFSAVFLNMDFNCYSRILSENSLDVMHIGFVHTFGNAERPAPISEYPPREIAPYHYKTSYVYESGRNSMVKKLFGINQLKIENEFVLPHTTVARVIFENFTSTVITFALPISERKSRLFVKTYRNFWTNSLGDTFTENMMHTTMLQDKAVVENIDMRFMDGKFNMKYDKLQNVYKTFYKRLIHNFTDEL